jgi:type IV secretory pathway VirB10-like protein
VPPAQVTEHVYDTVSGRFPLIPQGSRLIGKYDNIVAFGQERALVVWQRIILLDGSSIVIDNLPATDTSGHAGLADQVDMHTWKLLPIIGTFSAVKDGYAGTIRTRTISVRVRLIANDRKDADGAPDFRIVAGAAEIGAA